MTATKITPKQRALLEYIKPRSDRGASREALGTFHQSTILSALNAGLVERDPATPGFVPSTRAGLLITAKGREALGPEGEPFHGRKPEGRKP